ncbi:MAG: hypothetical protein ACHP7O_04355 [Burkholderiales bacterium]
MKNITTVILGIMLSSIVVTVAAQEAKPYKEGHVASVTYVKTKPGKFDDYMKYLDTSYKAAMEAQKKAGIVTGYSVFLANPRKPSEPDLILVVNYPNMAALDRGEEMDAIEEKLAGGMVNANKGMEDRGAIREILGSELVRELVLK